ncbi:MAG: hypothetical protein SynsKO_12900 [Synoicihabitans sp.]
MKILLIRNFEPDSQYSMLKFADCMAAGLRATGEDVEVLSPQLYFGRLAGTYRYSGISKWLGYIDKYIVFPRRLRQRLRDLERQSCSTMIHILDHGNASYVPRQSRFPWVVTCNDLLAVKAAKGLGKDVATSSTGRILQNSVFNGLSRADYVACISSATRQDLLHLMPDRANFSSVVWMGLNYAYDNLSGSEMSKRSGQLANKCSWHRANGVRASAGPSCFALHVGSNNQRKNREGILRTISEALKLGWDGHVVMAGEQPSSALQDLAKELKILDRFWWVQNPDNSELEFLYNKAEVLLFPSFAEGFGWPVIEAQACGCPVITSNTTSLPEVAGESGLLFSPTDFRGMATALRRLEDATHRDSVVKSGYRNAQRFATTEMIENYRSIYRSMATHH